MGARRIDKPLTAGRVFVVLGAFTGAAVAVTGIVGGWNPAPSLLAGLAAAYVAMNLFGTAERYWANRKVESSGMPGAGSVAFREEVVSTADQLNERMTDQMKDINQRLYDLEKQVFKRNNPGSEEE